MPPKNVDSLEIVNFFDGSEKEVYIGNEDECIFEESEPIENPFSDVTEVSFTVPVVQAEKIRKDLELDFDAFADASRRMTFALRRVNWAMSEFSKILIKSYPDKKAVHLALYAKKYRVRKKWSDRIIREMLKECEKR